MHGKLFGSKKVEKKINPNDTIQQMRGMVTTLDKREAHLNKKVQICLNNAKEKSKKSDKKGALFELKKKKMLEGQIDKIQGQKLNLEVQIMSLEDAIQNKNTLQVKKFNPSSIDHIKIRIYFIYTGS